MKSGAMRARSAACTALTGLRARRRLAIVCLSFAAATAAIPVACAASQDARAANGGQIDPALEATVSKATGGRLTTVHFYSQALHKQADYLVFLPAGYTPA